MSRLIDTAHRLANVALLVTAGSAFVASACSGPNFTACESGSCEPNTDGGEAGAPNPTAAGGGSNPGSAGGGGAPASIDAGAGGTGESGGTGEQTAGAPSHGPSGAAGEGGDDAVAGHGGVTTGTECSKPEDCDDGDVTNGLERCVEYVCLPGNPPPLVVSISPHRSVTDQEPDAPVVLTFSEELSPASVNTETLLVEANGQRVAGSVAYAGVTATFTPKYRLPLRGLVTVKVTRGVKDLSGVNMLNDFTSGFWVRDGAWGMAMPLDSEKPHRSGRHVPIDAAGNVLTTFVRAGEYPNQRAFSRFYHPGVGLSAFVEHTTDLTPQTQTVTAALNERGVGAIMWRQSGQYGYGTYSREYRDGRWSAGSSGRSFEGSCVAAGVSPADETHFCQGQMQRYLVRCAPEGTCTAGEATPGEVNEEIPSLAFDGAGSAVAAWRREKTNKVSGAILLANYSAETNLWSQGIIINNAYQAEIPAGGEPNVVAGPDGTALATWVEEGALDPEASRTTPPRVLLTSYYTPDAGWGDAVPLSLDIGDIGYFPPGVAFDGTYFVVAWAASENTGVRIYTRRFDGDDWEPSERRDPADSLVRKVMPQLASDASGDLLLTWIERTAVDSEQRIAYRRRVGGNWTSTKYLSETVVNAKVEDWQLDPAVQLGLGPTGVAALLWEQRSGTELEKLWLAVFE